MWEQELKPLQGNAIGGIWDLCAANGSRGDKTDDKVCTAIRVKVLKNGSVTQALGNPTQVILRREDWMNDGGDDVSVSECDKNEECDKGKIVKAAVWGNKVQFRRHWVVYNKWLWAILSPTPCHHLRSEKRNKKRTTRWRPTWRNSGDKWKICAKRNYMP